MATCGVLRCSNPPAAPLTLVADPLMETAVCAEHKLSIDAGAPYRWEPSDEGVFSGHLVMGDDFDAQGITVLTILRTERSGLARDPDGAMAHKLVVERLRGDGTVEEIPLYLTREAIRQLKEDPLLP